MHAERLASEAVEALATAVMNPAAVARSAELRELVRRWFLLNDQLAAFEVFAANPENDARVRDLLRQAVERDAAFARSLSAALDQAAYAAPSQNNSVHLDARGVRGGTFQAAGRDIHRNKTIEFSGGGLSALAVILLIGLVLLVLVLLVFAGRH